VCEGVLTTEAEEVELIVHAVGHFLGATHSPDPASAMRPTLGDGRARSAKFRVGLDPLNLLAATLWVNECRTGQGKGWAGLPPRPGARVEVVYKTIAHAARDDPGAAEYAATLEKLRPAVVEPGAPRPAPAARAPGVRSEKEEAVRAVVRAVAACASDV